MPAEPPAPLGETAPSGPAWPSWLATPAARACADATLARSGGAPALAAALQASRRDTLALFATFEQALPGLRVPQRAELNPPLWELGHIGWFQDFWLARNPQRALGAQADPDAPRAAARRADADALYNSSQVPHDARWALPLPDADATRAELAAQLAESLALLATLGGPAGGGSADGAADGAAGGAVDQSIADDDALYFFRLALLHEDMHLEAALYTAQSLGIVIDDPRWQAAPLPEPPPPCQFEPGPWRLGSDPGAGFAFDNELGAHDVALGATTLDAQVLRWAEYLPFVEAGGYDDECWWTDAGRAWRASQPQPIGQGAPRYLRRTPGAVGHAAGRSAGRSAGMAAPPGNAWQHWRHGRWQTLDLRQPACHLTHHEAQAWCRWAGRRLPTEAEWERAALSQPAPFRWGDVWEWTASPFAPYPGFVPHPYRDYSAPWFDGRPVLRGASFMTQPRIKHPRYRNYFSAGRNDLPAGFRSCAL